MLIDELLLMKLSIEDRNEQDYFRRISDVVFKYRKTQEILSAFLPVPEGLKQTLRKTCQETPAERFQSAPEFVANLATYLLPEERFIRQVHPLSKASSAFV